MPPIDLAPRRAFAGSPRLTRRAFCSLAALLVARAGSARAEGGAAALRIGYQKSGTLALLKEKLELATRLARRQVPLQWFEFQSGPPLVEALNAGSIDLGYAGDTPPIFAQAAGAALVYVGYIATRGRNIGLLLRKSSPIHAVAELKGKRIAFTKGSSAHNFVIRALAASGLAYGDIEPVYLQPADGAAAFRSGAVDAWAIWDPFYALAELTGETRLLTTAEAVAPSNSFFLAGRAYVDRHADIVEDAVRDLDTLSRWSETHPEIVAEIISRITGVDSAAERTAIGRAGYGVGFLTPSVVAQQQAIADTFYAIGLIPKAIAVRDAVWIPAS